MKTGFNYRNGKRCGGHKEIILARKRMREGRKAKKRKRENNLQILFSFKKTKKGNNLIYLANRSYQLLLTLFTTKGETKKKVRVCGGCLAKSRWVCRNFKKKNVSGKKWDLGTENLCLMRITRKRLNETRDFYIFYI